MIQSGVALTLESWLLKVKKRSLVDDRAFLDPQSETKPTRRVIMTRTHVIRICGLAAFAALTASIAWAGAPRSPSEDAAESPALKAIQGTWVTPENSNLDAKWVFKGEKLIASVNGMDYEGKVKVDDKAKPHATLDIELTEGPEDAKGKIAKAVYKLDGDKLIVCVAHPGLDRPKDFEPQPDEVYVFEMKKEKKA
jgi:uncharacterized protein (TIGR03067 family)